MHPIQTLTLRRSFENRLSKIIAVKHLFLQGKKKVSILWAQLLLSNRVKIFFQIHDEKIILVFVFVMYFKNPSMLDETFILHCSQNTVCSPNFCCLHCHCVSAFNRSSGTHILKICRVKEISYNNLSFRNIRCILLATFYSSFYRHRLQMYCTTLLLLAQCEQSENLICFTVVYIKQFRSKELL